MAPGHARHAMVVGEALTGQKVAAGIGCRTGASGHAVLAALDHALAEHRLARGDIFALATGERKRGEAGLAEAAAAVGLDLTVLGDAALAATESRALTISALSRKTTGFPSLSEAAALAAAGAESHLLGPRLALGPVTCALARSAAVP